MKPLFLIIAALSLAACATPNQRNYERGQQQESSAVIEAYLKACPNGITYANRSGAYGFDNRAYLSQVEVRCTSPQLPRY